MKPWKIFLVAALLSAQPGSRKEAYGTWSDYAGSPDSMQYSSLKQVDKSNISQLDLAWSYMAPGPGGRFAFSPLVVDGVMYVIGKDGAVVALNAATGQPVWTHPVEGHAYDRGFNYWESKNGADRRLIFAANSYLQEINLRTGVTINTFGKDGRVDLREGIPRARNIQSGTPGRVFENEIIVGSAPGEGYEAAPGDLRAFDVISGKLLWTFHTIPHPGEYGSETWPKDAWTYIGGVNAWGEISIDEKRGIAYFPLGSPTYDFYGADRKGMGLFGDTLLALDVRTGKRLWHFQLVHHDLWDYDPTTAPKLLTVRHNGKMVDIVAEVTKFGMLYAFDRVTGEPLWPIEERPVPKSDVPGEESWPTQPFPTRPPPYSRLKFSIEDLNPYVDAAEKARLRELFVNARNEGAFTPSTGNRDSIEIPGELGGSNWGGTAADPASGMLYVRAIDGPSIHRLRNTEGAVARPGAATTLEERGYDLYMQNCLTCHGPERTGTNAPNVMGIDRFRKLVRNGQAEMPAFPEDTISARDFDALVAYMNNPAAGTPPARAGAAARVPARAAGSADNATRPAKVRYYGQFGNLWHANNGLPAIGPPWSEMVAYDLNEGTIRWRIPLGTVSSLAEKGIRNTGSYRPTRNGPVVTAGGLIFMATASDRMVHAYDKDTGKLLWEREVEANPDGIPAVYETGGRQYVAFFAGANRSYSGVAWKAPSPRLKVIMCSPCRRNKLMDDVARTLVSAASRLASTRFVSTLFSRCVAHSAGGNGMQEDVCALRGVSDRVRKASRRVSTRQTRVSAPQRRNLRFLLLPLCASVASAQYATWSDYGGAADSMQYSSLKQIDKSNVNRLEPAWNYRVPGTSGRFGFNPVIVDDVMYVLGQDNAIVALNAATGKEVWKHPVEGRPTDRGINYWESKDRTSRRLIFAAGGYLQEIDTRTGVTIPSFGKDGRVDLREGIPRARGIQSGTPGRVFENLIIMGSAPGEGYGSAPGDLRAFDVLSGKVVWTFHTIPHPGEYGYDTWPKDAWTYIGGNNAWGEISIDTKRGIAYFPLGSPTYDFYGADRIGANLFGDCLLALDARTGKRLWHFQAVHHDLWDYDLTTGPKLLTVRHNGKMVDIVAQPTKFGFLYVFDRVTGEPLWPIEERAVPKSDVPGEQSWPTQPFPTKPPPFTRQAFTVKDINPYVDDAEKARLRDLLLAARNEGIFTPPAMHNTIDMPGELGGSNWGGAAADPRTGMLYVRSNDAPTMHVLSERQRVRVPEGATAEQRGRAIYATNCESCHGPDRKGVSSPKDMGADQFRSMVRTGRGQMPGFSETTVPAADLDALQAYLANPAAGEAPAGGPGGARGGPPLPPPPEGQTRYYTPYGTLNANNGLPAIGPPWSELTAYDLNEGVIKWQVPLGIVPSLAEKGIADTGSYHPTRNGLVVTAGGLIFIGTFSDRTVRAYYKDTGKVLWEKELEAGPEGIPSVYEVGGRQYVVFCTRAGKVFDNIGDESIAWKPGKPEAAGYYVFALPANPASAGKKR